MDWDKKVKMIELSNSGDIEGFNAYVLEHISGFDTQDWDMFAHAVTVDPEQIKADSAFWDQVLPPMKDFLGGPESAESSFKGRLRVSIIIEVLSGLGSSDL